MSQSVAEFARFLPGYIQQRLVDNCEKPAECIVDAFSAIVMFADISGFTPLANQLARLGPEGAEELDRVLNAYYGRLVKIVHGHGGDVVAFAGDAAICIWRSAAPQRTLELLRAAQCALDLQQQLHCYRVTADIELSMRISLGAGLLKAFNGGGVNELWHYMVVGRPFEQIQRAVPHARVGEIVLSPESVQLAAPQVLGTRLDDGHFKLSGLAEEIVTQEFELPKLSDAATAALRCFIPHAVLSRLDAGQSEWLADLRQLTVMFVNLKGFDLSSPWLVPQLDAVLRLFQSLMVQFDGDVAHFIQDDKGIVAILCFGLPPHIHEDDAQRSVSAAFAVRDGVQTMGFGADIGISSGRVFSGVRGSATRCEYSITGSLVNLAARLMAAAKGRILCDLATHNASRGSIEFEELEPLPLKGIESPVPVFHPTAVIARKLSSHKSVVGRELELRTLNTWLTQANSGLQRMLFVEGEAGIGKSALLNVLRRQAGELGFQVLCGECDAIERATPYFPWRPVVAAALRVDDIADRELRRRMILQFLRFTPEWLPRAALLNPFVDVEFEEAEVVAQLESEARADITHDLLLTILSRRAARAPLLVILDDVQWLDSASWRLLSTLDQRANNLSIAMAARPFVDPTTAEAMHIIDGESTLRMRLGSLKPPAIDLQVREILQCESLEPGLLDFIYERSEGNPFFVEELIHFLTEAQLIFVDQNMGRLATSVKQQAGAAVPGSVRALITNRVDRLDASQQMTLKTAAVVGRSFAKRTLLAVYEVESGQAEIDEHLHDMTQLRLIQVEAMDPEAIYLFQHLTIQQVIYDQIALRNRRNLHLAIAKWYEQSNSENPAFFPLLAYHWGNANVAQKQVEYLAKSGEEALRRFANREAVTFFSSALEKSSADPQLFGQMNRQQAHWKRQLGEALFHLGELSAAQLQLEAALEMMGHIPPRGKWSVIFNTLLQAATQLSHRWFPRWTTSDDLVPEQANSAAGLQESALAVQRLSQLHYLQVDLPLGISRALWGLNLAERAGRSPGLARAFAGMGLVIGMLRFHSWAELYARLSTQTARETNHLPTISYVLMVAGVYRLGLGQWSAARQAAEEAIELAKRIGEQRLLGEALTVEAMRLCFLGDFRRGDEYYQQIYEVARKSQNSVHLAWSYSGSGECAFRRGELEQAIESFREALRLLTDADHRTEEIRMHGLIATALWRLGDEKGAWELVSRAQEIIKETSCPTASTLESFAGIAEICLDDWQQNPENDTARDRAQQACRDLAWYAKIFPIGRSRLACARGRAYSIQGKLASAQRQFRSSLKLAVDFQMPYDEAYAHLKFGQSLPPGSNERKQQLETAKTQFERMECAFELAQANNS